MIAIFTISALVGFAVSFVLTKALWRYVARKLDDENPDNWPIYRHG